MDNFRRRPVNRAIVKEDIVNSEPVRRASPQASVTVARPGALGASRPATARPVVKPAPAETPAEAAVTEMKLQPIVDGRNMPIGRPQRSRGKKVTIWVLAALTVLVVVFSGVFAWYSLQLSPVDGDSTAKKVVTIESGSTPAIIAKQLYDEGLIRSELAFMAYTRVEGVRGSLQAGAYRLSPAESTRQIVKHIVDGKVDNFLITFLPGATLADSRKVLTGAGYSNDEITAAFEKNYISPLFNGKPSTADLEGYIYGETYSFPSDATVESILERTFSEFAAVVKKEGLEVKFKAQGLSLYEGITLASIIQREASPGGSDMPQIAQVFYTRLASGMELGSDVTYQYIADKTGVPRSPNLDSPYNTRKYPGLPPGPISAPGIKALRAVANPAKGDYVYFLSGDDDITYYASTLAGHEANIKKHCQQKCKIL